MSSVYPDADNVEDLRGEFATRFIDRSSELYATNPDFFTRNGLEFPIGEEGRQRGNASDKDTYAYFGIGLYYYFGDLKCPYEKGQ